MLLDADRDSASLASRFIVMRSGTRGPKDSRRLGPAELTQTSAAMRRDAVGEAAAAAASRRLGRRDWAGVAGPETRPERLERKAAAMGPAAVVFVLGGSPPSTPLPPNGAPVAWTGGGGLGYRPGSRACMRAGGPNISQCEYRAGRCCRRPPASSA